MRPLKPKYPDADRAAPKSMQLRVMVTPAMMGDIDRYANAWDVPRSSAARRMISDWLARYEADQGH